MNIAHIFKLFPYSTNTGFITITSSGNELINVQIHDVLGKQVKNENITNSTINVSNLNNRIYIVKITQNNTSTIKKLVIK